MNLSKECGNCKFWKSREDIDAPMPGVCKRKKIFKSMVSQACDDFKEYQVKLSTTKEGK